MAGEDKKCKKEKKAEYYTLTFRDDTAKKMPQIGTCIALHYNDGTCHLEKVYWGTEMDYERSRNGVVEMGWFFDKENTLKLMECTETHDARSMLETLYEMFKEHANSADEYLIRYCDKVGVKYDFRVYY